MASETLFDRVEQITDPRKKRGVRHPFHAILKLVILGYVCRLVWIEHTAVYAKKHWDKIKIALGFTRDYSPDATTIRRALQGIDRGQLEKAFEEWVCEQLGAKKFTGAVDGKALCNVAGQGDEPAQLVNVFIHDLKIAIAQFPTEEKKGEATVLRNALKSLFDRYPGLQILTGDAAYAGRDMCRAVIDLGRDYLIQIKDNQPKIKEVLELHFNEESKERQPDAMTTEKKDVEIRREIWVCDGEGAEYVREDLAFPGVKQVAKIRKTTSQKGKIIATEDWYGLTSCSPATLPPSVFLKTVRGHWSVENSLHHVKDRSWLEDKIYSKETEPGLVLGILRNLSLNLIRGFGEVGKKIKSMPKQALDLLLDPSETLRLLTNA